MAEIRTLEFNSLPRQTRERFIAITKNLAGPPPIFAKKDGAGAIAGWIILLAIAALVGLGALLADFARVSQPTQPAGMFILYLIVGFFFWWSVLGIVKSARKKKALPFDAGVYVFPMDTVVAQDDKLKIIPAGDLVSLQPVHHYYNGAYTNTSLTFRYADGSAQVFSVYGQQQAQIMLERLRSAGAQVDEAIARRDVGALEQLDPFFEARMSGWATQPDPSGPRASSIPSWMRLAPLFGLIAAVVVSPIFFVVRNLASDQAAFSKAKALLAKPAPKPTEYYYSSDAYEVESYARRTWIHGSEAQNDLVPRVKLRESHAKASIPERITEIKKIKADYPNATCKAEIDQALKDAVHDAFVEAKGKNTVAALREFQKAYPDAADIGAAKARIHELFTKTLADFKPRASSSDKDMVPFVESLLSYMESNDSPPMEVRFRRHNAKSLAAADKILASDPETGDLAGASSHFEPQDAKPREQAMVDGMKKGFSSVFPADVLPLAMGADLGEAPPKLTQPTILVDYEVAWSGSTYVDRTANRSFVGVIFDFDVTMTTPNDARVLKLKFSVRPPQHFTVNYTTFNDPSMSALLKDGPSDSQVYEVMALRAFDELSTNIQEKFFKPSRRAPEKPAARPAPSTRGGASDEDDQDDP